LPEPTRSASLALIREYVDVRLALSGDIAGRLDFDLAVERSEEIHRELWTLAGQALDQEPTANATLLYVDSLNQRIDQHTTRVTSFTTHIPTPVFWVQVAGSALALGVLALYFATLGRGTLTVLLAAGMVVLILLVNVDLDRPRRGFIKVPTNALVNLRDEVGRAPAAAPPTSAPR
jgi:hypothetical protein